MLTNGFRVFRARLSGPGDAIPPVGYVSQRFLSFLGIISDVTKEYLNQMVRKSKYMQYFYTYSRRQHVLSSVCSLK